MNLSPHLLLPVHALKVFLLGLIRTRQWRPPGLRTAVDSSVSPRGLYCSTSTMAFAPIAVAFVRSPARYPIHRSATGSDGRRCCCRWCMLVSANVPTAVFKSPVDGSRSASGSHPLCCCRPWCMLNSASYPVALSASAARRVSQTASGQPSAVLLPPVRVYAQTAPQAR